MEKCKFGGLDYLFNARATKLKIETFKKLVDTLSVLGFTGIFWDINGRFEIEGEPYYSYQRTVFSKEYIKEMDRYCQSKNIELKPSFQILGHLPQLGKYQPCREYMENVNVLLVDDERSYQIVEKIFKTARECFSSEKVLLGLDEAFGLGSGKHLERFGYEPRFDIMMRHIERVLKIAKKYGFTTYEAWPDMFIRHCVLDEETFKLPKEEVRKKMGNKLDKGLSLSNWEYSVPTDGGARIRAEVEKLLKMTDEVSFTGAVYSYFSPAPDNSYGIRSLKGSVQALKEYPLNKFIVSNWGWDTSIFNTLPTLYFFSEYCYGRCDGVEDLDRKKFKDLFGVDFDDFMSLDLVNKPHPGKEYPNCNNKSGQYLYNDPLLGIFDANISPDTGKDYFALYEKLSKIDGGEYQYLFEVLARLCKVLTNKAELGLRIKENYDVGNKEALRVIAEQTIAQICEDIDGYLQASERAWAIENEMDGEFLLAIKCGGLKFRLQQVARILCEYADGKIEKIEELCEARIPPELLVYKNATEDNLTLYGWDQLVTAGTI